MARVYQTGNVPQPGEDTRPKDGEPSIYDHFSREQVTEMYK